MKKLIAWALAALAITMSAPACAQNAVAYQETVGNRVVTIPVTPSNPMPAGVIFSDDGTQTAVSDTDPLPVTVVAGATSGTEFNEDAAHSSGAAGRLSLGVRKDTATSLAGTDGDYTAAIFDSSGRQHVNVGASALPTGAATEATLGDILTSLNTPATALPYAIPGTAAASACALSATQSAASTNATNVKASAGKLCGGTIINTTATVYYLRLYNLASAPTCSSATGFVATFPVPASTAGAGTVLNLGPWGASFTTGIGFCLTGGGGSTDNTNAATGVYVNLVYN